MQPHRLETFKFSRDPEFDAKLADIVGLYLDPPERALVLCVNEKSQIQALNRTQPALPMWPGLPARMTHDYTRHGTTSLFAALEVARGKVHGRCFKRHTHLEFIAFLESLARRYPKRELHLICDNYGTHKHPAVRQWLAAHPHFHLHFTPTSASWLNLVERWFALITGQAIRRGSFDSVGRLAATVFSNRAQEGRKGRGWGRECRCLPVSLVVQHGIENHEEFAHAGDERGLGVLTLGMQPQIESSDGRIAANPATVAIYRTRQTWARSVYGDSGGGSVRNFVCERLVVIGCCIT